jgi:hypothetical protein
MLWYLFCLCRLAVVVTQIGFGHSRTGNRSTRDGTEVLYLQLKLLFLQRLADLRIQGNRLESRHTLACESNLTVAKSHSAKLPVPRRAANSRSRRTAFRNTPKLTTQAGLKRFDLSETA